MRGYSDYTSNAPKFFSELVIEPLLKFRVDKIDHGRSGIYILYENGLPVYVGRTRNLQSRFRAHVTQSHNSASFALKRTRTRHIEIAKATYKSENSRQSIVEHPLYGETFKDEINAIKGMSFRFLDVPDPIDQYFLELFTTMELGLDLSGFNSY